MTISDHNWIDEYFFNRNKKPKMLRKEWEYLWEVLLFFSDGEEHFIRESYDIITKKLNISEAEMKILVNEREYNFNRKREPKVFNEIKWAKKTLQEAGILGVAKVGYVNKHREIKKKSKFCLTILGKRLLERIERGEYDKEDLEKYIREIKELKESKLNSPKERSLVLRLLQFWKQ